ncbi:MAG: class III poly(R)-hydroxyalkanoic acid synthase subunit PhaC [Gammaproteobacteria bacterium]|nr:MAG: class III poly(R)-hydroxyalkanoic acid synthase subunit PhaC [Gammaproteobacteria bacterium]
MNSNNNKISQESITFNRKLKKAIKNMANAGEIDEGVTPKTVIYKEDKLRLYRYQSPTDVVQTKIPTLIVYALVNRHYMTDIQHDRSMVSGLLETGQDLYVIDWGYPDQADRFITLDDYINGYLATCIDIICKRHDLPQINILGICQGGTLSLCYTALHPEKIKNLITMVTPVDFHTKENNLTRAVKYLDVDLFVDAMGNISGKMMNDFFLSLQPFRLLGQKYLDAVELFQDEEKMKNFLRMEKWIFDSPDQAGESFRQFLKDFYQKNKLIKGELELGNHRVDMKDINMPVLNVYAEKDHLVPPSASKPLKHATSSKDYSEITFKGGHIGIYVSGRAKKQISPAIGEWLNDRC